MIETIRVPPRMKMPRKQPFHTPGNTNPGNSRRAALAMLLLSIGTPAPAQTLAILYQTSGNVMVNQGEKHIRGRNGSTLNPGYRVMTMSDGFTLIEFNDGCVVTLGAREVFLVQQTSPCASPNPARNAGYTARSSAKAKAAGLGGLTRELHHR
ncbi:MAG: hypothetical protein BECKG1743D_GA0114223_101793 [Candidatus Kentron sp. G]|nr:MAG: hypothetical protein BECKG1743F_GA0114225_101563 [Candidatus Kentron sp. G]VFM97905.1 MAG: hypothetical protein BECKG1743E_GA0114224_101564 [Candidatus Kentron sp. G]VFN00260.1 MAG: hypothetical protein BECKG1743D_GA0114223_101793 [Candidatus Kentron sp. G]